MTDGAPGPPRKRRPRYSGTHPRRFEEKYKERDAGALSGGAREKVIASGKTPAGSHVPCSSPRCSRCSRRVPGDVAVDATLGWGGHAAEILKRVLPGGRLLALDVDPSSCRRRPRGSRRSRGARRAGAVKAVQCNYAGLRKLLEDEGPRRGADVILADLGVSSMQLDDPRAASRGSTTSRST